MKKITKNAVRALALLLVAATLMLSLASCGKKISEIDVATTEHYSVTAGMLTYALYDSYYYYVNYFGKDMMLLYFGIDVNVSLKEQYSDMSTGKTWFDVFKTDALDGLRNSLVLCEAAYRDGLTLNEIDRKFIQNEIDEIAAMGAKEGMELDEYIEYIYTDGVTVEDVKKCLEIYRLANKKRYNDYNSIEVSESDIEDDFDKNGDKYFQRDLIYFELVLSNDSAKNVTIKEYAQRMKSAANEDELRAIVKEYLASDVCQDTKSEIEKLTIKNDLAESDKKDIDKWAFAKDTIKGSTFLSESASTCVVYMAAGDAVLDASETRNIYTILFSGDVYGSDEEVKAKAEAIYKEWQDGGMDTEAFKKLASQYTTDYASTSKGGFYDNIRENDLVENLDEWVFDSSRKVGDHSLIKTEYGCHVVLYAGTGEPGWKLPVIQTIKDTRLASIIQSYTEMYPVNVISGNLKYVSGK